MHDCLFYVVMVGMHDCLFYVVMVKFRLSHFFVYQNDLKGEFDFKLFIQTTSISGNKF